MHIDLNLLRTLDVLLDEGSVGAAAERLHLSQPAMSRALARIRRATGDEILVRSGRGMVATPYAEGVRAEVHALVQRAQLMLQPVVDLDLRTVERTYTLQCNDALSEVLAPRLARTLADEAATLRLRFLAEPSSTSDDLRRGHVDLRVSSDLAESSDLRSSTLAHDRLVAVVRDGHPQPDALDTAAGFVRLDHVIVSRRGRLRDPVDEALEADGLRRRVLLTVATATTAVQVVSASDLVVLLPSRMLATQMAAHRLVSRPLPVDVPDVPIVMTWHRRHDRDPAHRWLRDHVRAILAERSA
ncbi:LysR family transcriptional regulator [Catenuloplanes sp. NPDC051500]|uniref:LysR family transcriptional regulator n=1 Tax=Catenuloplanes sp. NPDC051500 TaxID=3363959 RepID=UPI00379DCCAF